MVTVNHNLRGLGEGAAEADVGASACGALSTSSGIRHAVHVPELGVLVLEGQISELVAGSAADLELTGVDVADPGGAVGAGTDDDGGLVESRCELDGPAATGNRSCAGLRAAERGHAPLAALVALVGVEVDGGVTAAGLATADVETVGFGVTDNSVHSAVSLGGGDDPDGTLGGVEATLEGDKLARVGADCDLVSDAGDVGGTGGPAVASAHAGELVVGAAVVGTTSLGMVVRDQNDLLALRGRALGVAANLGGLGDLEAAPRAAAHAGGALEDTLVALALVAVVLLAAGVRANPSVGDTLAAESADGEALPLHRSRGAGLLGGWLLETNLGGFTGAVLERVIELEGFNVRALASSVGQTGDGSLLAELGLGVLFSFLDELDAVVLVRVLLALFATALLGGDGDLGFPFDSMDFVTEKVVGHVGNTVGEPEVGPEKDLLLARGLDGDVAERVPGVVAASFDRDLPQKANVVVGADGDSLGGALVEMAAKVHEVGTSLSADELEVHRGVGVRVALGRSANVDGVGTHSGLGAFFRNDGAKAESGAELVRGVQLLGTLRDVTAEEVVGGELDSVAVGGSDVDEVDRVPAISTASLQHNTVEKADLVGDANALGGTLALDEAVAEVHERSVALGATELNVHAGVGGRVSGLAGGV